MTNFSSRREFLRWSASFSLMGAAAPLALQLTAAGSAAAATATDYKAIICLFMQGGQDSNNMILATDTDSFARYTSARNTGPAPINLEPVGYVPKTFPAGTRLDSPNMWPGVRPITPATAQAIPAANQTSQSSGPRTFALHPWLGQSTVDLFQQKRLAILANVGTLIQPTTKAQFTGSQVPLPQALFSHNDQQSAWQSGGIEGAQTGWGGRLGDILASMNGSQPVFTTVSADGNAVFLSGNTVNQYQVSTEGDPGVLISGRSGTLLGSNVGGATLDSIIRGINGRSNLADDHATVVQRSVAAAATLNSAFDNAPSVLPVPQFFEPSQNEEDTNPWATQLATIVQLIAAAPALGVKRQVFFCRVDAHDTHDTQNPREALNMARLAHALAYLDSALSQVGGVDMRSNVTTFTASDFSRSFTANGTGTDHAWGGHHFILGGAVAGGDIYGQYPALGIDKAGFNNPDISGNNIIPTTSVDQYGATLGRWFGVSDGDLHTVFPNLANFGQPYLGFV